jgi:hypothetical protein
MWRAPVNKNPPWRFDRLVFARFSGKTIGEFREGSRDGI